MARPHFRSLGSAGTSWRSSRKSPEGEPPVEPLGLFVQLAEGLGKFGPRRRRRYPEGLLGECLPSAFEQIRLDEAVAELRHRASRTNPPAEPFVMAFRRVFKQRIVRQRPHFPTVGCLGDRCGEPGAAKRQSEKT